MSNRVRTGIILTILALVFLLPGATTLLKWFPLLGFSIVIFLCAIELYRALLRRLPDLPFMPFALILPAGLSPILIWVWYLDLTFWHNLPIGEGLPSGFLLNDAWLTNYVWLMGLGLAVYAAVLIFTQMIFGAFNIVRRGADQVPVIGIAVAAAVYLSFPLALVTLWLYAVPNGYKWLIFAALIAPISDISAYYVGKNLGKKPLIPKLSPHKTVEGFAAGLLISAIFGGLFFLFVMPGDISQMDKPGANLLFGVILGVVASLGAQFGDWMASAIKRWCRIKDYSRILGDHGGLLDRFDSILGTIPVVFLASFIYYFIER